MAANLELLLDTVYKGQAEARRVLSDIEDIGDAAESSGGRFDKFTSSLSSGFSTLAKVGAVGIGALATGLAAIGAAAFNTSNDIDVATKRMTSQLDLTTDGAEEFESAMTGIFANNFGESFDDIAASLVTVGQNMSAAGQIVDDELQGITENALAIRDAFEVDVSESANAAAALMANFGLTGAEAMDFITAGMQKGLNSSGDFLDSIGEYSTQFANAGADAGQFFSAMETGFGAGMLGTDRAADLFKEFRVRVVDGSDATQDAIKHLFGYSGAMQDMSADIEKGNSSLSKLQGQLELAKLKQAEFTDKTKESTRLSTQIRIEELTDKIREQAAEVNNLTAQNGKFAGSMDGLLEYEGGAGQLFDDMREGIISSADAFDLVLTAIGKIDDPLTRMQIGTALLGSQFEDMGDSAVLGLDLSATKLEDLAGSTEALNTQYDNLGTAMEGFRRRALLSIVPIGDALLKLVNDNMPKIEAVFTAVEASIKALFSGDFASLDIPQPIKNLIAAVIRLRLRWETDLGGVRTAIETTIVKTRVQFAIWGQQAERLWRNLGIIFSGGQDDIEESNRLWYVDLLHDLIGGWNLILGAFTKIMTLMNGILETFQGTAGEIWRNILDAFVRYIEYSFGPMAGDAMRAALEGITTALQDWWSGLQTWWSNLRLSPPTISGNFSGGGNVPGGAAGGGGGGFGGRSASPLIINQSFGSGTTDPGGVRAATREGVYDALSRRGEY